MYVDHERFNNRFHRSFFYIEHNVLASKIHQAFQEYQPCVEKNCGCHADSITKSLYPFRNGITKQMVDNVHKYGTKYQIISNKLYRDSNCMFPARCAGIEHFLKANIQKLPDLEMIVNTRDWPQINIHHVSLPDFFFLPFMMFTSKPSIFPNSL